ncbi:MAG TPA: hypothetical protein ENI29_13010 [bacterium]|nr:hypothetical protein [bacterium]
MKTYRILFLGFITFGIIAWNIIHLQTNLAVELMPITLLRFQEVILFISLTIVAPGLTLFIIYYVKKITVKFEGNFIGKYHLHEGSFGFILIGIGILFFFVRSSMIQLDVFFKEFKLFLAITMIFLYFFLFFAGFFIFRDFHDVIRLKFLEKIENLTKEQIHSTNIFNSIKIKDLHFYRIFKLSLFPVGILLMEFSFNMVAGGNEFLPKEYFSNEFVVGLGYFLCFIAGGIIGVDWFRIFKRFYPAQYREIEQKLTEIKKSNNLL